MTTTIPGHGLPTWMQLIVALIAVLGFLGGAAAFLLVIWPSIRRADRRADRLEKWMDGPDGKMAYRKLIELLSRGAIEGTPQDRGAFLTEDTGRGEVKGQL